MRKLILAISVYTISFAQGQTPELQCYLPDPKGLIREHNLDFISLDLHVSFTPEDRLVRGRAEYAVQSIQPQADSVFLDGPGIRVDEVTLDGAQTRFRTDSAGITVFFNPPLTRNQTHALHILYSANPKRGLYFNGWNVSRTDDPNDPTIIRKQIWTQGQGIDNRHWIPSYDGINDKVITAMHVTFDADYQVVSNGNLKSVQENSDGTKTWHYAMEHPHAMYLVMLGIGKYDVLEYTSRNGITSRQYYYPGTRAHAENAYQYSAELMDWMEGEIGLKYPWSTYANVPVQEFLYGAMENTTATIFSDFFYQLPASNPDKQYYEINAHELTHQWFGDYVTAWSGSSHWLQESFATYYAKKFVQHIQGDDQYHWKRRDEMRAAINSDNNADIPVAHGDAGSSLVYQKGSFVLDMMRYVAGDTEFKITIREFLQTYPYQNVTSQDLEMQFMRSLGMNMHTFFDQWLYRDGYPVYQVRRTVDGDVLRIQVDQIQQQTGTMHLFSMPIHVQAHYTDGSFEDQRVQISAAKTEVTFRIPQGKTLAFVLFDPNTMVMSVVDFPKEYTELRLQAFNAPNMMDRYDAITAMRDIAPEQKRDDLIALFKKERFFGIRSEIVYQLSTDDDKQSLAVLREAIYDPHPLVRRSVLTNLKSLPGKLEKDLETLLRDDNYTNVEVALRKLAEWQPNKVNDYLKVTNGMTGGTNNIRLAWLEIMCRQNGNASIGGILDMSSPQYEFRTRVAAFNALNSLNYCDQRAVENLFNALVSTNHRLSTPARTTLLALKKTPEYNTMILNYYRSQQWTAWEVQRIGSVKD